VAAGARRSENPYDYISTQAIAKIDDLNAKYDVILFPPVGFFSSPTAIINGMPTAWGNPLPWKNTPETPNLAGKNDSTDDMRPGLGWDGFAKLQTFVQKGGVLLTATDTSRFATEIGLVTGVSAQTSERMKIVGSVVGTRLVDGASPIAYGYEEKVPAYCDNGPIFPLAASPVRADAAASATNPVPAPPGVVLRTNRISPWAVPASRLPKNQRRKPGKHRRSPTNNDATVSA